MNTILHQKRNANFFITVGLTMALVIVAVFAIATSATMTPNVAPNISQDLAENTNVALEPLSADTFPQYRQSEWHSVAVTNINGLEAYHQSERTLIPAQAGLMAYQLSERTLSPIVNADFSQYHLSERTMTGAIAIPNLSQYFVSERTLVDLLAGLATYFESERTSIAVPFTQYQLSEWFGK
jgi:hypothetical protein